MTTILTGQVGLQTISAVATRKRDVALKIALLDPKQAPLVLLSQVGMDPRNVADVSKAKLAKTVSVDPKIEWLEDVLDPSIDNINLAAGYGAGDVSILVNNANYFQTGCYVYVKRTGEIMYVSAGGTNPTDALTVARGALGTTAAALNDKDEIIKLSEGNTEGDTPPTAKATLKSLQYNYLQTFRTPLSMTDIIKNTAMLGEERDYPYQVEKHGTEHSVKIERGMLYGMRYAGTATSAFDSSTQQVLFTNGLVNMLTSNVYDAGGTITEEAFNKNISEPAFTNGRGSNYRILLTSDRFNTVICTWGNNKIRLHVGEDKLGFTINSYMTPQGTVYIIPHHLITGTQGVAGILIDPAKAKYRYLQNMDTRFKQDTVKKGQMGTIDEYQTVAGLQYNNQETGALVKNVQN